MDIQCATMPLPAHYIEVNCENADIKGLCTQQSKPDGLKNIKCVVTLDMYTYMILCSPLHYTRGPVLKESVVSDGL